MKEYIDELNIIKNIDFDTQFKSIRLWVVKKTTTNKINSYRTLYASIDGLDDDFKETLKKFFCGIPDSDVIDPIDILLPYAPITIELDENKALVHPTNETDFKKIIDKISAGSDSLPVDNINDFNNAWALVVEFILHDDSVFYGFSKVKGGWKIKENNKIKSLVFSEGNFKKIDHIKIFNFRDYFDFISYKNVSYIRNKANYELGLNIREGLLAKRDILVDEFKKNGIITSVDDLTIAIGSNKTLLRRLIASEQNRYYEDQQFIEDMKAIIKQHNFNLNINDDGKFIVDENNIDLFLKLINDKRFISLIKKQMVDADTIEIVK